MDGRVYMCMGLDGTVASFGDIIGSWEYNLKVGNGIDIARLVGELGIGS